MATGPHIIHRLVLHIEVPDRKMAKPVQDEVLRQCEAVILPRLERLLDSMDTEGHIIIDRLDLDLGAASEEQLLAHMESGTPQALETAIRALIEGKDRTDKEEAVVQISEVQNAYEVFLYFLRTGQLPWNVSPAAAWLQDEEMWMQKIETAFHEQPYLKKQLSAVLVHSEQELTRLFHQFSIVFIRRLAVILLDAGKHDISPQDAGEYKIILLAEKIKSIADAYPGTLQINDMAFCEQLVLAVLLRSGKDIPELAAIFTSLRGKDLAAIIKEAHIVPVLSNPVKTADNILQAADVPVRAGVKPEDERQAPQRTASEGIYTEQAGLVLLHPYIKQYLGNFVLVQDGDFPNAGARQLTVHLLHYMATGKVEAFEHELHFEKFLCAWPANIPIERQVHIPQGMLDEADDMLRAVIRQWSALKSTSVAGLREAFLQRHGKLVEKEEIPLLVVERKTIDVLLATLPWGFGVIKFPWMHKPLYVEWQ
jgi:hypothetical protein